MGVGIGDLLNPGYAIVKAVAPKQAATIDPIGAAIDKKTGGKKEAPKPVAKTATPSPSTSLSGTAMATPATATATASPNYLLWGAIAGVAIFAVVILRR